MPELPEVETIRAQLDPLVAGRSIVSASSHPSAKFTPAIEAHGAQIEQVRRRGKYLLFDLDDQRELIVHLGMTGVLSVPEQAGDSPYVRAQWELDDGRWLVFNDVRRFGRITAPQNPTAQSTSCRWPREHLCRRSVVARPSTTHRPFHQQTRCRQVARRMRRGHRECHK